MNMKAIGKLKKEPGIWMYEAPKPQMGPSDVLVKIQKTSICGTDVHIYNWDAWAQKTIPVPMTIGHEFYGIVEEVGCNEKTIKPGDRVSGECHLICWDCRNCRAGKCHLCPNTIGVGVSCTGCFAEYFVLPASNVIVLPDKIEDNTASLLDPLGNAVHTALSFDLIGESVLITGAGPIGLMAAAIARYVGARHVVITDVNEYRLKLAEKVGVTRAVNVAKENLFDVLQELHLGEHALKKMDYPGSALNGMVHLFKRRGGDSQVQLEQKIDAAAHSKQAIFNLMKELRLIDGFEIGLEMSGSPAALNGMLEVINHGGKIGLLGILPDQTAIDWSKVIFKGLLLKGIYGREIFQTWHKMIALLESGLDVSPLITHVFPADEYQQAFEVMRSGNSGKVVLDWTV